MRSCAALLSLLIGCARPWVPVATDADAARSHRDVAQLNAGRAQLIEHCSGCHQTPSPREHRASDWPAQVDDMAERAHLSDAQRIAITLYLTTVADRPR